MEISAAVVSQVQRDVAPAKSQEVDKQSDERKDEERVAERKLRDELQGSTISETA